MRNRTLRRRFIGLCLAIVFALQSNPFSLQQKRAGCDGEPLTAIAIPPWLLLPLGAPTSVTASGEIVYTIFGLEVFAGFGYLTLLAPVAAIGVISYQIAHWNPPVDTGTSGPPCKGTGAETLPGVASDWSISGEAAAYADAYADAKAQCAARASACVGSCKSGHCMSDVIPGTETYGNRVFWTRVTLPFICQCYCLK